MNNFNHMHNKVPFISSSTDFTVTRYFMFSDHILKQFVLPEDCGFSEMRFYLHSTSSIIST